VAIGTQTAFVLEPAAHDLAHQASTPPFLSELGTEEAGNHERVVGRVRAEQVSGERHGGDEDHAGDSDDTDLLQHAANGGGAQRIQWSAVSIMYRLGPIAV
jgi:hypothetical protein